MVSGSHEPSGNIGYDEIGQRGQQALVVDTAADDFDAFQFDVDDELLKVGGLLPASAPLPVATEPTQRWPVKIDAALRDALDDDFDAARWPSTARPAAARGAAACAVTRFSTAAPLAASEPVPRINLLEFRPQPSSIGRSDTDIWIGNVERELERSRPPPGWDFDCCIGCCTRLLHAGIAVSGYWATVAILDGCLGRRFVVECR